MSGGKALASSEVALGFIGSIAATVLTCTIES